MDYLSPLILAIVQGITEWLPVSSSGHLVIFQHLLGLETDILLDTALHFATLLAVLIVYAKDLGRIIKAIATWNTASDDFKLAWQLILATLPIAITGFLLKDAIEAAFSTLWIVGVTLLITGAILYGTRYAKKKTKRTTKNTFLIGLAQVIALLPGISRSGTTIAAGIYQGLDKEESARFSFLLFVPAVLGASILQAATTDWTGIALWPLITSMLVATTVSVIVLRFLIRAVKRGKLNYFAWYCWGVGAAVLIWALV